MKDTITKQAKDMKMKKQHKNTLLASLRKRVLWRLWKGLSSDSLLIDRFFSDILLMDKSVQCQFLNGQVCSMTVS